MEELYRAHAGVVLAFLISLCRDRHQAEDLMQETFIRATRAIGGYRGGNPRSWLLAIARTTFLDAVRKRRADPTDAVPDEGHDDVDVVERLTVHAALGRLSEPYRTALVLRDELDLPYQEVAQLPDGCAAAHHRGVRRAGGRVWDRSTGADHALGEVRRAVENLAGTDLVSGDDPEGALANPGETAALLTETEPEVMSVVLTGPTDALADIVDAADPRSVDLLEVDFDRGAPRTCD